VKALAEPSIYDQCRPLIICDAEIIRTAVRFCHLDLEVNPVEHPSEANFTHGKLDVINMRNVDHDTFRFGIPDPMTGNAAFEYVVKAIELAMNRMVDALVTGPISKEAIAMAGYDFAGHTEIFAHYTNTGDYAMMLAEGDFRVIHVSTHVPMREAIDRITKDRVLSVIKLAEETLKRMGFMKPRIAVAGLNPHAGEHGLFGNEDLEHILPAVKEARNLGINADGPHPPDTVFPKMKGRQYDIVVCMYHDQGHIPTKLLGFNYNHEKKIWEGVSGVNVTLGLPLIRVSVDHGTAFDRAGRGEASPESMIQAISYASLLARNKDRNQE
jgi:4-hydroxythreonine-4-phosphate dehydrogenase